MSHLSYLYLKKKKLKELKKATAENPEMQKLKDYIMKGWPAEKSSVHKDMQRYWTFKDTLKWLLIAFNQTFHIRKQSQVVPTLFEHINVGNL